MRQQLLIVFLVLLLFSWVGLARQAAPVPDLQKQLAQLKLQNAQLRQALSQCSFNEAKRDEEAASAELAKEKK